MDTACYDVIVVGGGHAGTEAALAAARMGRRTLLLTQHLDTIGQMSCNPAVGGIGKGHLAREVDALGGVMARAADAAGIQMRRLNASKGPAVRATRAQCDRTLYRRAIRRFVEAQPGLQLFQAEVADLIVRGERVQGVVTSGGQRFQAPAVVLTVGTFLGGRIFVGQDSRPGGRAGDAPSNALAERLRALPLRIGRLKTGTPPRIDGRSIDYSVLTEQPADDPRPVFSFIGRPEDHPPQVSCWIAHTNPETHRIIAASLDRSPMFSGAISGRGPRYCPSIEDKIHRFADRDAHQIFVEPEGLDTFEVYPNGISTSLPYEVQLAFVRSIRGFERAHITRPGYAIEYDYLDPRDVGADLHSKLLRGLFLAGQINGTTGYEEAAAQGILAGINAALHAGGQAPWIPGRHEAYIGVLVDDLVTLGTSEPYRMFTSRAEHRLLLREDNADLRLTPLGRELGLVDDHRWAVFTARRDAIARERERLAAIRLQGSLLDAARARLDAGVRPETTALDLLRRPDADYALLCELGIGDARLPADVREQVQTEARYAGYIARQQAEVRRNQAAEHARIPPDLDYAAVPGLSAEVREKLAAHRPETLGQAGRISGVTPAAISLLRVHLRRIGSDRPAA